MIDVIINPIAGHGRGRRIGQKIIEALRRRGLAFRSFLTEYPGHATQLAHKSQSENTETVLSVGGDGTAYEIACGLIHSKTALGIVPAGTGNDFVKTLGMPKNPLAALEFILSHPPRLLDVGRMNDQMFLNVCGTGFDVSVLQYSMTAKKYVRGLLPYLYGVIRTIFHFKSVPMEITIDDQTNLKGSYLICSIANGRFIGGGIPISPTGMVDDGQLDVVLLKSIPNWKMIFYLPGLLMGLVRSFAITSHYRCSKVSIHAPGMLLNVDGEILPIEKASFAALKSALLVHW